MISQSCDACAKAVCAKDDMTDDDDSGGGGGGGPNVGAIAGGVVAAVAVIAIAGLIFFFMKRRKRREQWNEGSEKPDSFTTSRRERQSGVGSIASTVLTRASNVIPIAYIPGVTNRSPPDSPGMIPPVPPIPAATPASSHYEPNQRYFMPGDIRDSVWSTNTQEAARQSISPSLARSSVATTIYRNNAIVAPVPAQQVQRAKAAMVSVRSGTNTPAPTRNPSSSSNRDFPAVPAITVTHINKANAVAAKLDAQDKNQSSIVARSGVAKPINLTKKQPTDDYGRTTPPEHLPESGNVDKSDQEQPKNKGKTRESGVTVIEDSPVVRQSPFADSRTSPDDSASSSAVSEATARPVRRSIDGQSLHRHQESESSNYGPDGRGRRSSDIDPSIGRSSPFSDDHEIRK